MPIEQHYRFVISALKALLFLIFSVAVSFSHAASPGRLIVLSSLGQPLRVEIELMSVTPEEAGALVAKLVPSDAYKQSGIDYTSLLQSLNISVEKEGGRYFVSIRSTQPVNEPYIGILLALSTDSEQKGREYVIMLDPAEWTNLRSAPLSSAASMQRLSRQQRAGKLSSKVFPVTAVRPSSVLQEKEAQSDSRASYVVSRGDSLSKIAGRLGIRDVSLEQILVALYRHNPEAFLNKNMNLLKEGTVLSVPPMAEINDISRPSASRTVRLHAANFRAYSHRLASMVQKSAARPTAKTGVVAEGRISASIKENPSPVSKMPDRLELSKARPDAASTGMTAEEKNAMNRAIEDANRRITELEKNVSELRSLLDIVSKNGNALTKPADAVTSESQPEAAKPQETQPKAEEPEKTDADTPQAAGEKTSSSDKEAVTEEKKEGADSAVEEDKKTDASQKADDEDESDDEDEEEADTKKRSGFFGNAIWYVAIGVSLVVLFLIVLVLLMRNKKPALAPAPASSAGPQKGEAAEDEEEEDVNPNIISGRDFLENLTGRDFIDDEEEDEGRNDASRSRYEDEDVREDFVSEPEEIESESEEMEVEPEDVVPEQEEKNMVFEEPVFVRKGADIDDAVVSDEPNDDVAEEAALIIESEEELDEESEDEPAPLELDLSDINLADVADEEDVLPDVAVPLAEAEKPEPYNAEMAAKLELAQAYLDMKDGEGARELLEEVLERGTPGQIDKAQQLIQYL